MPLGEEVAIPLCVEEEVATSHYLEEKRKKKVVNEISTLVHLARVREHPHICKLVDVCLLQKAAEETSLSRSFLYLVYPRYGPSLKLLLEKNQALDLLQQFHGVTQVKTVNLWVL